MPRMSSGGMILGRGPQQCEQPMQPHTESADRRIALCMDAAVCLLRLQRAT